jgi:anti-anti-sigma factor
VNTWRGAQGQEPPSGSITVEQDHDGPVMYLRGDIDAALLARVRGGEPSFDGPGIVAVDVSELGYIDSSGLAFLVRWAQARSKAGEGAVIRRATPRFSKVLSISGLTPLFICEG